MKALTFTLALAALCAPAFSPTARAADVELTGYFDYTRSSRAYNYDGYIYTSGRKSAIRAGYSRYGSMYGGDIENYSPYTSGSLSWELWRFNYYGGYTGTCLTTYGLGYLYGGDYFGDAYADVDFKSPGKYGYTTMVLSEYQYSPYYGYYDWFEDDRITLGYEYF